MRPSVVVDANVAKAAGTKRTGARAPGPESVHVLKAIQGSKLDVVFNAELRDEWFRHRRPFAITWLRNMVATKRFVFEERRWQGEDVLLNAAVDLPGAGVVEVAKDLHVVGLAMLTNQRVVSLDSKQRRLLIRLCSKAKIGALHWVSPLEEGATEWLLDGAPQRASFTLGHMA